MMTTSNGIRIMDSGRGSPSTSSIHGAFLKRIRTGTLMIATNIFIGTSLQLPERRSILHLIPATTLICTTTSSIRARSTACVRPLPIRSNAVLKANFAKTANGGNMLPRTRRGVWRWGLISGLLAVIRTLCTSDSEFHRHLASWPSRILGTAQTRNQSIAAKARQYHDFRKRVPVLECVP